MANVNGGATTQTTAKVKRFGNPPAYLDGRPHFLDASYQQVLRFGRRPGGPSNRELRSASVEDEITPDGEGQMNGTAPGHGDANGDGDVEQPEAGPSTARSPLPRSTSFDEEEADEAEADGEDEDEAGKATPSTDSEWEYEDLPPELVIFDLGPEASKLLQSKRQWASTGLETGSPFLKVGNVVFKGAWEESLTTGVVLKDELDRTRPFPHQHHPSPLPAPLPSTTHNRIKFRPAVNLDVGESAATQRSRKVRSKLLASRRVRAQPQGRSASAEGADPEATAGDVDMDIDPDLDPSASPNPLGTTSPPPPKTRKPGRPALSLAQRTQKAVQRSLRPDVEPRVTQRIAKRMKMQEKLLEKLGAGAETATGTASADAGPSGSGTATGAAAGGSTPTPSPRVVLLGEGGSEYLDLQTGEVKRLRGRGRPIGSKNRPRVEQTEVGAGVQGEERGEGGASGRGQDGGDALDAGPAEQPVGGAPLEERGRQEGQAEQGRGEGEEEAGTSNDKGKEKAS